MKKIGFFGGSFDPIHFGHINLGIQVLESGLVDEILFCPAYCSPFKTSTPPVVSGAHRLEMIRLVIAKISGFNLTSIELDRQEPSFTVDTLKSLAKGGEEYRLILSQDSAARFRSWKEPEEIIRLAPPIVGLRGEGELPASFASLQMPLFDISSTEIRRRIKEKIYCGHLVPTLALDYIAQHKLY
jgi:nicotinate-nucleotide adenylyltransferase